MKLNDRDKAIVKRAQEVLSWIQQEKEIQWSTAFHPDLWRNLESLCFQDFLRRLISDLYDEDLRLRVKPKKIWMKTLISDKTDQEEVANKWKQDGYSVIEMSE